MWNIIDFALNFMLFKIAALPDKFPGTGLNYDVSRFKTSFAEDKHYVIALKVDFK